MIFTLSVVAISVCSFALWLDHNLTVRMRIDMAAAEERIRDEVLADIETRRAERLKQDAELCAWLLRWKEYAQYDIQTMTALVEEFRELTAPYQQPSDGTEN